MEETALDRLDAMDEESLAREDESEEVRLDSAEETEEMTLDAEEVGALLAAAAVPPMLVASGYAPLLVAESTIDPTCALVATARARMRTLYCIMVNVVCKMFRSDRRRSGSVDNLR